MIRVVLPFHLQTLAGSEREISLDVGSAVTLTQALAALESDYPMLRGTVRDHVTLERRPRVRFFAAGRDITHEDPDTPLPPVIADGAEPLLIVGAVSGG